MAHEVVVEKDAAKYLSRLPHTARIRIVTALSKLESNPYLGKSLSGRLEGLYSLRVGAFRAIYSIEKAEVVVHAIAPRGQVYK